MRIAFLLEPTRHGRGLAPVITETVDRPRGRGVQVDLLFAQDGSAIVDLSNLRPEHDLYVLKSKSPLTHSLAGAIEADGGFVVNSFASAILTWVKVATTGVLAAAGIPVPASWTAGRASLFRSLIEQGPLWLKPQHGKSGSGVRRVDDLTTLEGQPVPAADTFGYPVPVFAQRDVSSGGLDFKVYVIGDRLWSMVKHVHQRRQDHLHDRGVQVYSMNVDQTPRVGALQAPPARHVRRGRPIGAGSLRRGQPCSRH